MGEQADGFELEFVQKRDNVGELPVARVPLGWSVSPSCAAKVRRDHAVVLGKLRDDLAPLPPVLCDFVEQHERLAAASLGHMHAKPWKLDKAVLDPFQTGKHSVRGTLLRHASGASDTTVPCLGLHPWLASSFGLRVNRLYYFHSAVSLRV